MKVSNWREIIDVIVLRKVSFLVAFFVVFLITYAILSWLDFLPEPVSDKNNKKDYVSFVEDKLMVEDNVNDENTNDTQISSEPEIIKEKVIPNKITFDSLKKSVVVLNPDSRKVEDLDRALLEGVVRHPDSATLEQQGTVFILGHSSYLPTVLNANFKAFNGIQDLKWGDVIRLEAGDEEYVYRVDKVFRAEATKATVPIAGENQRLVLATCNSFGSVDDRYIVEADLLEVVKI